MQFGGRLAAAIEILQSIETHHRPASEALRDWGISHRFAGSSDRSFIGNIVYDVLRNKSSSGWILDDFSPRGLVFGLSMLEWELTPYSFKELFSQDKFSPPPLNDKEITLATQRLSEEIPDQFRANCPDWCFSLLQKTFGEDWIQEAQALSKRPPLDLRANTLLSTQENLLKELSEINGIPCFLSPYGIRIPPVTQEKRHPNVCAEPSFHKGFFEVQDEGSQIVTQLVEPQPGNKILDLCAGAGGKTLSIAAMMKNTGKIFAYDIEKIRLSQIFERLKRSEAHNVETLFKTENLAPLKGKMDIVIADVPCTGSGVWRRRPDTKWRLTQKKLQEKMHQQEKILEQASYFVKPGGKLIYITCSIFDDENKIQILNFINRYPTFILSDYTHLWEKHFPNKNDCVYITREGILLSPFKTNTDGFFFCTLQNTEERR